MAWITLMQQWTTHKVAVIVMTVFQMYSAALCDRI